MRPRMDSLGLRLLVNYLLATFPKLVTLLANMAAWSLTRRFISSSRKCWQGIRVGKWWLFAQVVTSARVCRCAQDFKWLCALAPISCSLIDDARRNDCQWGRVIVYLAWSLLEGCVYWELHILVTRILVMRECRASLRGVGGGITRLYRVTFFIWAHILTFLKIKLLTKWNKWWRILEVIQFLLFENQVFKNPCLSAFTECEQIRISLI